MLPIERLPRTDQLLINKMASFLKGYDTNNVGLVVEILMMAGFQRPLIEQLADYAIQLEKDRALTESLHPRFFEKADAFIEQKPIDIALTATAVAACAVMALGIHFVTPLVWAVFV